MSSMFYEAGKTAALEKLGMNLGDPYTRAALQLGVMLGGIPAATGAAGAYVDEKETPIMPILAAGAAGVPTALGGGYLSGRAAKHFGASPRGRVSAMLAGAVIPSYAVGHGIGEASKLIYE
jgi:hypothetical protein